jgi:hypothetical protein
VKYAPGTWGANAIHQPPRTPWRLPFDAPGGKEVTQPIALFMLSVLNRIE